MFKYGKRLAALALTALLCLPVAAYAEGEVTVYSMDGINVYEAEGEFEVNIPAEVSVDPATKKAELPIVATLEQCSNLEIGIKSQNDYHLKCGTQELAYYISDKNVVFWKNDTTEASKTQTYTIDIEVTDIPTMSGTYEDHLTFTMERKQYEIVEGTYLLTFDTNDSNDESLVISTDYKYVTQNEEYGMLPVPKRDGYTFAGWYTAGGDKVTDKTVATSDAKLYAYWTAHTLTFKYHNDGADKITWDVDPYGTTRLYPGAVYEYVTTGKTSYIIPQDTLLGEDVTLMQVETYGASFSNGTNGLFDVWRWNKDGKTGYSQYWKIGEDGVKTISDKDGFFDDNGSASPEVCAEKLGVLEAFKRGNVEVDLYPIWSASVKTIDESDVEEQEPDKTIEVDEPTDAEEEPTISDDVTDTDDTKAPAEDETDSKDTEDTETPADTDKTEPADKDDTATGTDDVDDTSKDTDIVDKDDADDTTIDDADSATEPDDTEEPDDADTGGTDAVLPPDSEETVTDPDASEEDADTAAPEDTDTVDSADEPFEDAADPSSDLDEEPGESA